MRRILRFENVDQIPKIEWARLAAFLDGEGHITIARQTSSWRKNRSPHPCQHVAHVSISNTDPRLPMWLRDTFGGSQVEQQKHAKNPNWKDIFHWRVTGKNASLILRGCYQYLILKRDQADIALAFNSLLENGSYRGTRNSVSQEDWNKREEFCKNIHILTARGKRAEEKGA